MAGAGGLHTSVSVQSLLSVVLGTDPLGVEQGWHDLWPPERHEPVGTTFQTLSQHRLRREGNPPICRTGASAQQAGVEVQPHRS